jgi:hypothetical protein
VLGGSPACEDQTARVVSPLPTASGRAGAVGEWFEEDDAVPFLMQVFQIREEKRAQIPAVTHVDGSDGCGRPIDTPTRAFITS